MFCSQFLREESCKLLARKPLFSEWSGRKRPWEFHSSGCQFPSASLVSIWSPHPQLCPSPQHPQPVYLTFLVFHEGEEGMAAYVKGSDMGSGGYLFLTQPILLCHVSPAPLLWGIPGTPNSWAFLGGQRWKLACFGASRIIGLGFNCDQGCCFKWKTKEVE